MLVKAAHQVKGTDVDNDLAVVAVQLSDIPAETLSQLKICLLYTSRATSKSAVEKQRIGLRPSAGVKPPKGGEIFLCLD